VTQLALLMFTAIAASDLLANPGRLRVYLRAAVAASIPVALYGVAQYFGWDPWIPKQAYHIGEGIWTIVRPPGTLGYVSYFANYLVFAVFFGACLVSIEQESAWRILGAAGAALGAFAIVLSGTRGALLALAIGALWLGFRLARPLRYRLIAAVAVGAIALIAFYFSPPGQMLRSRTRWYQEDVRGGARLLLWRDSLSLAARHWLVGLGPETFSTAFPRVQSAELAKAYPDFYQESAHNALLDVLTAQGLIGLLALGAWIGLGLWSAALGESTEAAFLGAALIAAFVAQQFAVFILPTALYFYLTVVMLARYLDGGTVAIAESPTPSLRRVNWIALPVSAVFLFFAVRLLIADRTMAIVQADLAALKPRDAAIAYERARRWGITADLWYSRQASVTASKALDPVTALLAWQQSLESGVRATTSAEDPLNAWYQMASLYARQNNFERTERCLRAAIASSPNWFKPHWMLAQVLATARRRDEALREAALAADLDGGKNPEVTQTLAQIEKSQ
jgi:O-antigen ligase